MHGTTLGIGGFLALVAPGTHPRDADARHVVVGHVPHRHMAPRRTCEHRYSVLSVQQRTSLPRPSVNSTSKCATDPLARRSPVSTSSSSRRECGTTNCLHSTHWSVTTASAVGRSLQWRCCFRFFFLYALFQHGADLHRRLVHSPCLHRRGGIHIRLPLH